MAADQDEGCSWCGVAVEPSDGFRAYEPAGSRRAAFCRLEHVVPWELQGPDWGVGETTEELPPACSQCNRPLDGTAVLLVRHRGEHRISDGFCSSAQMAAWAKAGGRWSRPPGAN